MTKLVGLNCSVEFDGERIVAVGPHDPTARSFIVAGFVDLQVNGVDDVDFGTARDAFAIAAALDRMTAHGTTACLPTIVTAPLDSYDSTLDRIREARDLADASTRAAILGVHLEGPFLGGAPGAHPQHLIRSVRTGTSAGE